MAFDFSIFNNLFPLVFLKYITCNTTESVSITGIAAIINKISGIFKYNAKPDITPPSNNDPVSPINTFAGCELKTKNPNIAPTNIKQNIPISWFPESQLEPNTIIPNAAKAIIESPPASPSNPSVRFTALLLATNINKIKMP